MDYSDSAILLQFNGTNFRLILMYGASFPCESRTAIDQQLNFASNLSDSDWLSLTAKCRQLWQPAGCRDILKAVKRILDFTSSGSFWYPGGSNWTVQEICMTSLGCHWQRNTLRYYSLWMSSYADSYFDTPSPVVVVPSQIYDCQCYDIHLNVILQSTLLGLLEDCSEQIK